MARWAGIQLATNVAVRRIRATTTPYSPTMANDRAISPKAPPNIATMRNGKRPLLENASAMVSTERGVTSESSALICWRTREVRAVSQVRSASQMCQ